VAVDAGILRVRSTACGESVFFVCDMQSMPALALVLKQSVDLLIEFLQPGANVL
jgi:hypothetical protein